jgi:hypothetical protein
MIFLVTYRLTAIADAEVYNFCSAHCNNMLLAMNLRKISYYIKQYNSLKTGIFSKEKLPQFRKYAVTYLQNSMHSMPAGNCD